MSNETKWRRQKNLARTLALDITELLTRNDMNGRGEWLVQDGCAQFSVKIEFVDGSTEYGQAILVASKFDPAGNPEEIRRFKITVVPI